MPEHPLDVSQMTAAQLDAELEKGRHIHKIREYHYEITEDMTTEKYILENKIAIFL